ncbi:putative autotransporter adhesin-like protein [Mucilaginibacter gracilis]|uniref:Putative autotransporter adhesin-like protein n=1 Tax=Mucilaginibacter gracilis TaxID=423350 RepID=A0A495JB47_9SPHI|nr:head GIN domain-containing protein [Mucilaginibacter gracilis]RKR85582.1 putative autotransporter adhesin-like protein [Mucilaginibacter gracilis]
MKTQFVKFLCIAVITAGSLSTALAGNQTRSVSGFSSIASSGAFNIHVKIDGTETLKITAPDDIINEIETIVENGTLKIKNKNEHFWNSDNYKNQKVDVYITAKSLSTLINSGSGSIKVDGTIGTSKFRAVLSGSGSISTGVKADDVSAVISGSGSINLNGKTNSASLVITGSGSMNGKNLNTQTSSIVISGSGDVYISADKQLSSRIVGSGSVQYSGNATVNSTKIGSGSVTQVNN